MSKLIKLFILSLIFINGIVIANPAQEPTQIQHPPKPQFEKPNQEEIKKFNEMLVRRLDLSAQQQEEMAKYHTEHRKQMYSTMKKMKNLHDEIANIYKNESIPKYEADFRTFPMKAELAILRQNAHKQKLENRKKFESILNDEQKAEFEVIKKELKQKHPHPPKFPKDKI